MLGHTTVRDNGPMPILATELFEEPSRRLFQAQVLIVWDINQRLSGGAGDAGVEATRSPLQMPDKAQLQASKQVRNWEQRNTEHFSWVKNSYKI